MAKNVFVPFYEIVICAYNLKKTLLEKVEEFFLSRLN